MRRKRPNNSRSGTSTRGGRSGKRTTMPAENRDAPKQLVRFDFPAAQDGDEEPDFKAMAEAFQEFARKAMADKLSGQQQSPPADGDPGQ